jgi:uncharacterized protein (TIGR02270 family)
MRRERIIGRIVQQHAEDAGDLRHLRSRLSTFPAAGLEQLAEIDDRIDAHIDALAVAGEAGWHAAQQFLGEGDAPAQFPACLLAIESRESALIERCLALAETAPKTRIAVTNALEWVFPHSLEGTVADLLRHASHTRRGLGLLACAMHCADPGQALDRGIEDPDPSVRMSALQTVGVLGRKEHASTCLAAITDADPECRFWATRSAVLLGERDRALKALSEAGLAKRPQRAMAFRLALQATSTGAARGVLEWLAKDPAEIRWLVQGAGIAGDPTYIPWLIARMEYPAHARLAGEAFTLITGADITVANLEGARPKNFEVGPNDNPQDPDVAMDPDEGLAWPDVTRVHQWWESHAARYEGGTRYFMGAPVTRAHCIDVLKNGYQRQRILAAHYLCLLEPGTPLFNTSAPAWRQQKLLAQME